MRVYIVVIDNGELLVFENPEQAYKFTGVRGGCEGIQMLDVIDESDAKRLIEDEIKERRDEERMRQAGL